MSGVLSGPTDEEMGARDAERCHSDICDHVRDRSLPEVRLALVGLTEHIADLHRALGDLLPGSECPFVRAAENGRKPT